MRENWNLNFDSSEINVVSFHHHKSDLEFFVIMSNGYSQKSLLLLMHWDRNSSLDSWNLYIEALAKYVGKNVGFLYFSRNLFSSAIYYTLMQINWSKTNNSFIIVFPLFSQ